jgi:hypothetical protein
MSYRFPCRQRSPADSVNATFMTDGNSMQGSPSRNHTSHSRVDSRTRARAASPPSPAHRKRRALEELCARAEQQCTLPFIALRCSLHGSCRRLWLAGLQHTYAACTRPTRELRALRTRSLNGMQRTGPGRVPMTPPQQLSLSVEASTWGYQPVPRCRKPDAEETLVRVVIDRFRFLMFGLTGMACADDV